MFSIKRHSVILLVVLLALVLSVPVSAQDATISAAQCAAPGTLTMRVWDENWAETIGASLEVWKSEYCPGAEVEVEVVPWGQYWDLLRTDAASGDLPDIFNMSQDNFYFYASNDALLDLQPYFDEAGLDPTVWGTGLVDPYRWGENQDVYGAPVEWVTVATYYNKDMFDAAGLEYPTSEWTWDDFAAAAAALTNPDSGVYGAAAYAEYMAGYGSWIASTGVAPVVAAGRTACTLQEPGSLEALNFLKGMLDAGYMPPVSVVGGTGADDAYNLFKSGQVAMITNGAWKLPNAFEELEFNWDVVQLPRNPETGRSRSLLHAVSYVGAANTENPELVGNLINFLVSDAGQQFFADAGGVAPGNPAPQLQQSWIDGFGDTNVNVQAFVDATVDSQGITVFGEVDQATTDLIVNIFDLGVSVEDATAQACAEIEPFLTPAQ